MVTVAEAIIQVREVVKRFGERTILNGINLMFCGRNAGGDGRIGVGEIERCLPTADDGQPEMHDGGQVLGFGKDINAMKAAAELTVYRKQIGVLFPKAGRCLIR